MPNTMQCKIMLHCIQYQHTDLKVIDSLYHAVITSILMRSIINHYALHYQA